MKILHKAIGALALLTLMLGTNAKAGVGDGFWGTSLGLAGDYTEPTGGEVTIRKADDEKREAGPWRFMLLNGDTPGDWALMEGKEVAEGEPTVYYIVFAEGPFKDERYTIVLDNDGKVKELHLVGGRETIWTRQ